MKKRILIISHAMELGGAERALLGLLENIDYTLYEIDLFFLRCEGELMRYLPPQVRVLPEDECYSALGIPLRDAIRKHQFRTAIDRLIGKRKAVSRIRSLGLGTDSNVINEYSHKYTVNHLPIISDEIYDVVISFVSPHYIAARKTNAKKKIAWIHTDYDTLKVDAESELHMWDAFDKIVSISEDVTASFLRTFPTLACKVCLVENIMPGNYMQDQTVAFSAKEEMPEFDGIKLLSIGRFVAQKNIARVPELCRKLVDRGVNVRWYLIGFGMEAEQIKEKIHQFAVQDRVIVLGKKENPYPYIAACDVYVQPSLYEGKSIAVREAQILHKPVIITNYSTAGSQLTNGVDGAIVPMETEECVEAMEALLRDSERLRMFSENTKKRDYVGAAEIATFNKLIEE